MAEMTFQSCSAFSKKDVDEAWIAWRRVRVCVFIRVSVCALMNVCLFCLSELKKKNDLSVLVSKSPA